MIYLTDDDGHRWAMTGLWCSVCVMPLHPSQANRGTHPSCDPTLDPELETP